MQLNFLSTLKHFMLLFLFAALPCWSANPQVLFETDVGSMTIELYPDKAPVTVANFLTYVNEGFYNGTIFHRVIPGFVVQGGGHTFDFTEKVTREPIVNEANNGLLNLKHTLSMARTNDPNSATAQFFINLQHNTTLDFSATNPGYAVFGKVIAGAEVLDKIVAIPRGMHRSFREAPNEMVRVVKATQLPPIQ